MVKWKPFNTLLKYSDILEIEKKKSLMEKPIILEDKINEINLTLNNAITNNLSVSIKYFNKGRLLYINGIIEKVYTNEKYILINKTRIYFENIINITID